MNIPRPALSEIVNGRRNISAAVALKLEKAFGATAQSWLHQQSDYELWQQSQSYQADEVTVLYAH